MYLYCNYIQYLWRQAYLWFYVDSRGLFAAQLDGPLLDVQLSGNYGENGE